MNAVEPEKTFFFAANLQRGLVVYTVKTNVQLPNATNSNQRPQTRIP